MPAHPKALLRDQVQDAAYAAQTGGPPPPPPTTVSCSQPPPDTQPSAAGPITVTAPLTRTFPRGGGSSVDWAVEGRGANPVVVADFVNADGQLPHGTATFAALATAATVSFQTAARTPPTTSKGAQLRLLNPAGCIIAGTNPQPFSLLPGVVVSANRSGLTWKSGVTVPANGMPSIRTQVEAFETYRGRLVDVVGVKVIAPAADVTWSQYGSQAAAKASIFAWLNGAAGKPIQAALSVTLICKNNLGITMNVAGGPPSADATTFVNAHKAAAQAIAAFNPAVPVIVRIGREYTATPGDDSCLDHDSDQVNFSHYKLAHQRAADAWHTYLPGCIIDGCALYGSKGYNFSKYYPGDDYWDVIGADMYDNQGAGVTDKASWLSYRDHSGGGPTYWLNLAKSRGKKLSIAELGLTGGDHPAYIYGFWHEFLTANAADISHEVYFNISDGPSAHQLNAPGVNPNATLEYQTFMSTGGSHFYPSGW